MGKNHIKRINVPKSWPIKRKSTKWISKPRLGSQPLQRTLSINTIMKELLGTVKTSKEVKVILNKGYISVDNKIRKDPNFPVSVLDVITIKDDNYRLLINTKGKLFLHPIKKQEVQIKPRKIIGKKIIKGKKLQLNFLDGTNLLSKDTNLKVSDTIIFENKNQKEILKFDKGALIYLIGGKQVGKIGIIKEIQPRIGTRPVKITFQSGKEDLDTLKEFAVVIGKTKPIVDISNE